MKLVQRYNIDKWGKNGVPLSTIISENKKIIHKIYYYAIKIVRIIIIFLLKE